MLYKERDLTEISL
jgi:hypothetical protein